MDDLKLIQGAGGGGGGGKGGGGGGQVYIPTEADDSLRSVQYATILDLISEGEIQGLDDGLKSVYLDGTPVQSSSGNDNFTGYTAAFRTGTQAQTYIPNLAGSESEKGVGTEVLNGTPVTRTITDSNVDRTRVTIQVPSLRQIEDDGDIIGFSARLQIQVQYNGGGYSTVVDDTISGKTTNAYQRDYLITLSGAFPVDVRVVRISPNEATIKKENKTIWTSYTEIIDEKLRYPNSALAYLRFDSRQFNNIPARKYLVRGIKVQLPSNATVDTTTHKGRVTYSGVWDGTLGAATWCADPAWCLYDLLTNTRYGAGIPASSLDKFDFYNISQYCNELVNDGFGAQEPRFQCHMLLNSREEVYNVIQEFVSLFRGIAYYGAGAMVVLQDKPVDAQYLLGPSNVIDGNFSYSGSSQKTRHTTATVAYQSYDTLGEVEFEYVEDAAAIAKFGVINKDIRAMGCYSRGQAHRLGKWLLLAEQNLTETVTFGVSIDSGIVLRPGMVINIADPVKAGARRMGRIHAATTTSITIDDANLTLDLTKAPTISVVLPTGNVELRAIQQQSGTTFTVTNAFSQAPDAQSAWLIETNDIEANQFRVISVTEGEGGVFSVTALAYNESIYAAIEADLTLEFRDISNLSALPDPPSSIKFTEHLYQEGQNILTAVDVSWISPVQRVSGYKVEYRLDNNNWVLLDTQTASIRLTGLKAGTLEVQIRSINTIGKIGNPAIETYEVVGKTAVPGNVQNLTIEPINANSARLRWDQTVDLDVKVGGRVHIRHNSLTDGTATWSNSIDLIPAKSGAQTEAIVPLVEGEIIVKFEDDGGRQSAGETSVIVDFPDALGFLVVDTRREDQDTPPFQGAKTDVFYDEIFDALTLDGSDTIDDVLDVDAIYSFDFLGDVVSSGEYTFANTLDLGGNFALDLKRYFVTRGFYPNDTIDARVELMDLWTDFDGGVIDQVNAKLLFRATPYDPAGAPTWSDWQEFVNGTFNGRGFQFKAELISNNVSQNILVDQLGYEATFQRRTDQSQTTITSSAGATTVTYDHPFFAGTSVLGGVNAYPPSVGITAQNMQSGDYFQIGSVTGTNFVVTFYNSSNVAVSRNFTWTATGYGKRV